MKVFGFTTRPVFASKISTALYWPVATVTSGRSPTISKYNFPSSPIWAVTSA